MAKLEYRKKGKWVSHPMLGSVRGPSAYIYTEVSGTVKADYPIVAINSRRGEQYHHVARQFLDTHPDFKGGVLVSSSDRSNFGESTLFFRTDAEAQRRGEALAAAAKQDKANEAAIRDAQNRFHWDHDCSASQMHDWPLIDVLVGGTARHELITQEEFISRKERTP